MGLCTAVSDTTGLQPDQGVHDCRLDGPTREAGGQGEADGALNKSTYTLAFLPCEARVSDVEHVALPVCRPLSPPTTITPSTE